jgi:hypothetical protein
MRHHGLLQVREPVADVDVLLDLGFEAAEHLMVFALMTQELPIIDLELPSIIVMVLIFPILRL